MKKAHKLKGISCDLEKILSSEIKYFRTVQLTNFEPYSFEGEIKMLCIIKFVRCPGQTVILEGNEFLWNTCKRKSIPATPTYRHWKQSVTFVWNESINFGLITSKLKKTYFKEVPKISWGNFHHVIQIITPPGNLDPNPPHRRKIVTPLCMLCRYMYLCQPYVFMDTKRFYGSLAFFIWSKILW